MGGGASRSKFRVPTSRGERADGKGNTKNRVRGTVAHRGRAEGQKLRGAGGARGRGRAAGGVRRGGRWLYAGGGRPCPHGELRGARRGRRGVEPSFAGRGRRTNTCTHGERFKGGKVTTAELKKSEVPSLNLIQVWNVSMTPLNLAVHLFFDGFLVNFIS